MTRTAPDNAQTRYRHRIAIHLQEIEGNPYDEVDYAMFAMFAAEGWSFERRHAHITARARAAVAADQPGSF